MNQTSLDVLQQLEPEFQYRELKGRELRTERQLQEQRDRIEAENQQFLAHLESLAAEKEQAIAEHHAAVSRGNAVCAIASVTLLSFMLIPGLNRIAERTLKLYEWTTTSTTTTATTVTNATPQEISKTTTPAAQTKVVPFKPLKQHRGLHFLDDSPSGSYDYTLERDGSTAVPIPSPCNGVIGRVWFQGRTGNLSTGFGAGQIVEVACDGGKLWLFGHLVKGSQTKQPGDRIIKGEALGIQGQTGRTSGVHVHNQIHKYSIGTDGIPVRGDRITDRSQTRPLIDDYHDFLATGGTSN
ncbi:peptidoglycan DD-metalloendopeptidase family protein [Laspinema sp. D1]|uniref:peptidoglycan DD-metalloendopeptidase family protein n=1 Tax=Laspinema palackyanum TaxID=3231601 RepID=UPI00348B8175|nr:peptidoglycan DD-metalloendopeptidase family protein [Laspinema sp. D2b]